jgi:hypothetical protein
MDNKSGSGSGMNNSDHISESLKNNFWVKILQLFDPGWGKFGSLIRDGKKSGPGSGINIPDPQHCLLGTIPGIRYPGKSRNYCYAWFCKKVSYVKLSRELGKFV